MLKPKITHTIADVWIELTYPNGVTEFFQLEAPNGEDPFKFHFVKIPKLDDYRDGENIVQRGSFFYQLIVIYDYKSHNMDLKKLLVAENIKLRFPPAFGQLHNYNVAHVLLKNDEVVKNYVDGLALAGETGETVPSGSITLEFEGIDAFTEFQVSNLFGWNQSDNADDEGDEDEDFGPDDEDFDTDIFYATSWGGSGFPDDHWVYKCEVGTETPFNILASFQLPTEAEEEGINLASARPTIHVARNGNVLAGFTGSSISIRRQFFFLFDSDLNLIKMLKIIPTHSISYFSAQIDADNTMYIPIMDDDNKTRKYDQNLDEILWTGSIDGGSGYRIFLTRKFVVSCAQGSSPARWVFKFRNKEDGSIEKTFTIEGSYQPRLINFIDGTFMIGAIGGETFKHLYNIDGELIRDDIVLEMSEFTGEELFNTTNSKEIMSDRNVTGAGLNFYSPEYDLLWYDTGSAGNWFWPSLGNAFRTKDPRVWRIMSFDVSSQRSNIFEINLDTQVKNSLGSLQSNDIHVRNGFCFAMKFDNWQLLYGDAPTPSPFLFFLNVYPKVGSAPHTVTVESGVVNRTNQEIQVDVLLDGDQAIAYNVPANDSRYLSHEWTHEESGTFVWSLGDKSETVYVDTVKPPGSGTHEGSIEVLSGADASFLGKQATGTMEVVGSPIRDSDPCDEPGEYFRILFEGTWYCLQLPKGSKSLIASAVSGQIAFEVPNLLAHGSAVGYTGNPLISVTHEQFGSEHNGKTVTFSVNSNLEGPVFKAFEVFLMGGEDPAVIDDPIDIIIGGFVFATTENIIGSESQASIATKIFEACNSIDTDDLSFEKTGNKIRIISNLDSELSVSLRVHSPNVTLTPKEPFFDYSTENIVAI